MNRFRLSLLGASGWAAAAVVALAAVAAWQYRGACPGDSSGSQPPPVRVVATVNGQEVTWDDLEFEVLAQEAAMGVRFEGPEGDKQLAEMQRSTLDRMIDRLLLVEEARRRGHEAAAAEVGRERDRLMGRVPDRTELARRLAAKRYGDQVQRAAVQAALGNRLLDEIRGKVEVTPQQVEEYYRANLDRMFRQPPSVLADELLLPSRDMAEAARQRFIAGRSVEEVGREFGVEPRRMLLLEGATDPERVRAAWDLPVGGVSQVVRTLEGAHAVLKVAERRPTQVTSLEQARPAVERILRAQGERRILAELLTQLRAKAKIERHWSPDAAPSPAAPSPSPTPSPGP